MISGSIPIISSSSENFVVPDRAKAVLLLPLSFRSEARNLVVPDRAKVETAPPLSFRSEARNLLLPCLRSFSAADDCCGRSLPLVEMTAGAGRDAASLVRSDRLHYSKAESLAMESAMNRTRSLFLPSSRL